MLDKNSFLIQSKNINDLIKTQSAKTFLSEPVLIKAGPLIIFYKQYSFRINYLFI
jgi:hypothetical protein